MNQSASEFISQNCGWCYPASACLIIVLFEYIMCLFNANNSLLRPLSKRFTKFVTRGVKIHLSQAKKLEKVLWTNEGTPLSEWIYMANSALGKTGLLTNRLLMTTEEIIFCHIKIFYCTHTCKLRSMENEGSDDKQYSCVW